MNPDSPIDFLRGEWRYERLLVDRKASLEGRAEGLASFRPEGDGLRWVESGRLELGTASTVVNRELLIVRESGEHSGWMVLFDDRRPFHPLVLGREECEVDHPCRDDQYHGRFRVGGPDSFRTTWEVDGPLKDQLIETAYQRVTIA